MQVNNLKIKNQMRSTKYSNLILNFEDLEPVFLEKSREFFKKTLDNLSSKGVDFRSNIFRNGENLFSLLKDYINVLDNHSNMQNFESITTVNMKPCQKHIFHFKSLV